MRSRGLAEILDNAGQFAAFEDRYMPRPTPLDQGIDDRAVVEKMFAELEMTEQRDQETSQSRKACNGHNSKPLPLGLTALLSI